MPQLDYLDIFTKISSKLRLLINIRTFYHFIHVCSNTCNTSMFLWNSHILITQIHHHWLLSPTFIFFAFVNRPYPNFSVTPQCMRGFFVSLLDFLHIMPSIHHLAVVHNDPDRLFCYLPGFSLLDCLLFSSTMAVVPS